MAAAEQGEGVVVGDQLEDGQVVAFGELVLADEGVKGGGEFGWIEGNRAG